MGKINQKKLEEDLDDLLNNICGKDEVLSSEYYLEYWEKLGYDVKRYKEELNLIKILTFMPENYLFKTYNQN